ncbi:MAG: helix-turn-helix domain-containing protein, partial [Methylobacter sp.]
MTQIYDLEQAAEFLKMNPEVLRRKAKLGLIPGRKAGKRWIFVCEHLADWVSGRFSFPLND